MQILIFFNKQATSGTFWKVLTAKLRVLGAHVNRVLWRQRGTLWVVMGPIPWCAPTKPPSPSSNPPLYVASEPLMFVLVIFVFLRTDLFVLEWYVSSVTGTRGCVLLMVQIWRRVYLLRHSHCTVPVLMLRLLLLLSIDHRRKLERAEDEVGLGCWKSLSIFDLQLQIFTSTGKLTQVLLQQNHIRIAANTLIKTSSKLKKNGFKKNNFACSRTSSKISLSLMSIMSIVALRKTWGLVCEIWKQKIVPKRTRWIVKRSKFSAL